MRLDRPHQDQRRIQQTVLWLNSRARHWLEGVHQTMQNQPSGQRLSDAAENATTVCLCSQWKGLHCSCIQTQLAVGRRLTLLLQRWPNDGLWELGTFKLHIIFIICMDFSLLQWKRDVSPVVCRFTVCLCFCVLYIQLNIICRYHKSKSLE